MAKSPRVGNKTSKRTPAEREHDLTLIASFYLQGIEQAEITQRLNARTGVHYQLTQSTISRDIKRLRELWLQSSLVNFNERMALELAKIDQVEREAWEAWRASRAQRKERHMVARDLAPAASSTKEDKAPARMVQRTITDKTFDQTGAGEFLRIVQSCIDQRLKIFGMYAPTQVDITWRGEARQAGIDPDAMFKKLVDVYVEALSSGKLIEGELVS